MIPQCAHHVTQRGNQRRQIFFTTPDRNVYLGLLKQYAEFYSVEVLGYCLMTNHVHLVLIPDHGRALAKLLREVQMRYSQYRNAIEHASGHLWQGRYYSCAVDPDRLAAVMRYVELNPVRAGLVQRAIEYEWSSAAAHLGEPDRAGLLTMTDLVRCWSAKEWAEVLEHGQEEGANIREATYGGRPLGSENFVARLEEFLGRRLRLGLAGRPKKELRADAAEI